MSAELSENTRNALLSLASVLKKHYGNHAPRMLIYGSWARGKAQTASDVDVLLLFSSRISPGLEIRRISKDLADINIQYGALISILPVYELDFLENTGPFWKNVKQEAVTLESI